MKEFNTEAVRIETASALATVRPAQGVGSYPRMVKILMRLPDGNISAAHPSVLYSRLIRHHDPLPS